MYLKKIRVKIIVLAAVLISHALLFSQTSSTISPYSRYGIGELQNQGFAHSIAMAQSGICMQNDSLGMSFINISNPASYSTFKFISFETGFVTNLYNIKTTSQSSIKNNVSLGYIAFGIPLKKWWGTSFGVLPYSSVGYKISDEQVIDSVGKTSYVYEGSGGINKIYWGHGFKLGNFNMGFNANYLFGDFNYSKKAIYAVSNYLNTKINSNNSINDLSFDYGAQYTIKIDSVGFKKKKNTRDIEDIKIMLGLTILNETSLKTKEQLIAQTYLLDNLNKEIPIDTILNTSQTNVTTIPFSIAGGIGIKKGQKWFVGGEYKIQYWNQSSFASTNVKIKNSSLIGIGTQYVPQKSNYLQSNYWRKINYRLGVKYHATYLELNNTPINEYSLSVGMGLPVGRIRFLNQSAMLNFSFEYGKRGTTATNLIAEQFIRSTIAVTINDKWFIKSKFD